MKAAFIRQTGTPDVIEYGELATPEPGPTEVLVKVGAVSVNPIDTYIRSGMIKVATSFPYIIGCDLAGTVERVGSQATRFKTGDRVWDQMVQEHVRHPRVHRRFAKAKHLPRDQVECQQLCHQV